MTDPGAGAPTGPGTDPPSDASERYAAPTAEQVAERARRADRATRGALAGLLGLEALVVLLIPRAIAYTDAGLGAVRTSILIGLAVVLVVAAGMTRRPFGIGLGSALQVLFIATGFLLSAMFGIGVIFAVIWLAVLTTRHELVGTPGGAALLYR